MNPETWRYIFDAIDAPIFLHDQEYRVLLANRAYCREAGVAEADALNQPYWEVFPRGDGPLPGCQDALDCGHVGNRDEVSVGEKLFISTGYAVRDDQGKLLYSLHILSDITAQHQAETALRQSEAEIRLLLDTLPQKIFYKNRDSVYVACNASYARDLGIASGEIQGRSDFDFYPQELAEKYRADDQRLLAADQSEDIEETYLQDGQERWVHTVKTPMRDEKGEPTGILGIFWDVTKTRKTEQALRQSEAFLRATAETARDAIITLDGKSGAITAWNHAAEAIFGYSKEEVIGRVLHEILTPPRFREASRVGMAHFATTGEGGAVGKTLELVAVHKNGTEFPIELSLATMNIDGQWFATGIARDITERKKMEFELRETRDYLGNLFDYANAPIIV
ncbi:MAG: PAS domain S-box protein [Gallionella sp.]|nr:PAS domain S-box protein [Gallionella sp.]